MDKDHKALHRGKKEAFKKKARELAVKAMKHKSYEKVEKKFPREHFKRHERMSNVG